MEETKSSKVPSLWDNPAIEKALKSMNPADVERYKEIGESMYKDIDFETSSVINKENTYPSFVIDAIKYIEHSIKNGQHISSLSEEEKNAMTNVFGTEWYLRYGFIKEDLDDVVTFGNIDKE